MNFKGYKLFKQLLCVKQIYVLRLHTYTYSRNNLFYIAFNEMKNFAGTNKLSQVSYFSNSVILKSQTKTMSGDKKDFNVSYDDILEAQKDESILIIDIREQVEINETGKLPGSIHIPMSKFLNYLKNMSEESFKETFNRSKPNIDTKVIVSCKSGTRSGMVQQEMQKLGYKNVYNYTGGWLDWENKIKCK